MRKKAITVPGSPAVLGPYSVAAESGGMVFISGQIAQDCKGSLVGGGDVAMQTEQALKNMEDILSAEGLSQQDVASVTVYLQDVEKDFGAMNKVYASHFEKPYPARVTVQAKLAEPQFLVEISAIAVK